MKLTKKEIDLATQFARNLAECERRDDFGGQHQQAARDLEETIYTHMGYLTPASRIAKSRKTALTAWVRFAGK